VAASFFASKLLSVQKQTPCTLCGCTNFYAQPAVFLLPVFFLPLDWSSPTFFFTYIFSYAPNYRDASKISRSDPERVVLSVVFPPNPPNGLPARQTVRRSSGLRSTLIFVCPSLGDSLVSFYIIHPSRVSPTWPFFSASGACYGPRTNPRLCSTIFPHSSPSLSSQQFFFYRFTIVGGFYLFSLSSVVVVVVLLKKFFPSPLPINFFFSFPFLP